MTSCLLPLFFLFSLCASIPPQPPGLKVRVTERGLEVVKDFVIAIFKGLENRPFPPIPIDLPVIKTTINELTFTKLDANNENLVLTLKEGSLLIEIKELPFHARLQRKVNADFYFFKIQVHSAEMDLTGDGADGGLNLKIDLQLKRIEEGKLGLTMLKCEAGIPTIKTNSGLGWTLDLWLIKPFLKHVCASLKHIALPKVNSMLKKLPMKLPMEVLGLKLAMDYSVTQDITVTPSGLDLPLRGLVYLEGQENVPANTEGADLDLGTDSDKMLYLGISDFFLNSYAASLYEGGAMTRTWEKMDNRFLNAFRNIKNQGRSNENITVEFRITELPIIHIKREGINVQPKFTIRAISGKEKPEEILELSVVCDITFKVEVEGENLIAPSEYIDCKLDTMRGKGNQATTFWLGGTIKAELEGVLKDGVKIPLLPKITFVQGPVTYHKGFMVLAGSLDLTEDAMKTLAETIVITSLFQKLEKTEKA